MPESGPHKVLTATAVLALLGTCGATAQTDEQLDRLIFDPVLLDNPAPVNLQGEVIRGRTRYQGLAVLALASEVGVDESGDVPENSEITAYQQRIASLELAEGQFAPGLIQDLLALSRLYQAQGSHAEAIALLERADHISRINFGLYDPGQVPIIESQIESHLALSDFAAVIDKQRYLLYMNRKLGRTEGADGVPALAAMADGNMVALDLALLETNDYSNGPLFRPGSMNDPGEAEVARYYALSSLFRARNTYAAAITALLDEENNSHPRLLELQYKYLETEFLLEFRNELIFNPHYYMTSARKTANLPNRWTYLRRNHIGYEAGIGTFLDILQFLENDAATSSVELVRTHIEFADWHLLFGWGEAAAAEYARAYARGQALGLEEETMLDLFSPAFPLQLPLFTALPNSRDKFAVPQDAPLAWDGYIDVRMMINRNGTARGIRILDASADTAPETLTRLRRYLKNSPFRPRIVDGKPVNWEDVGLRYYYTFQ